MLLRCCLIHTTINILRYILYLVYLCPCLGPGPFMSCICDSFFIFSFIFIVINNITSLKQTHFYVLEYSSYSWMIPWMKKVNNFTFNLRMLLSFCLIFRQFQTDVVYKSVAFKRKRVMEQHIWKSWQKYQIQRYLCFQGKHFWILDGRLSMSFRISCYCFYFRFKT